MAPFQSLQFTEVKRNETLLEGKTVVSNHAASVTLNFGPVARKFRKGEVDVVRTQSFEQIGNFWEDSIG